MMRLLTFFMMVTATQSDLFITVGQVDGDSKCNISYTEDLNFPNDQGITYCLSSLSLLLKKTELKNSFHFQCPTPSQGLRTPINLTCLGESNNPTLPQNGDARFQNQTCVCWDGKETSREADNLHMAIGLGICLGLLVVVLVVIACHRLRRHRADNEYEDVLDNESHVLSVTPLRVAPKTAPSTPPSLPLRLWKRPCSSVSDSGERISGHLAANRTEDMNGRLPGGPQDSRGHICDGKSEPRNIPSRSMGKCHGVYCAPIVVCNWRKGIFKSHKEGHTEVFYGNSGMCGRHTEICNGHIGTSNKVCNCHTELCSGHKEVCIGHNGHVGQGNQYTEIIADDFDTCINYTDICDCPDVSQEDDSVSRASLEAQVHTEPGICLLGLDPVYPESSGQAQRFSHKEMSKRYSARSRGSLMSLLKPKLSNGEIFTNTLTSLEISVPRQERLTRTSDELPSRLSFPCSVTR